MNVIAWAPITETEWIPPLGEELRKHIEGYSHFSVRHASCSAWGLLYKILVENGCPGGTVVFDEHGKPGFLDCPVFFSISHSREICAAAISSEPIGVDVELWRDTYKERLIERSLSENEKKVFDQDFTRLWCRKEAIAKLTGTGIVGYPNDIDTEKEDYIFWEKKVFHDGKAYWLVACSEKNNGCQSNDVTYLV